MSRDAELSFKRKKKRKCEERDRSGEGRNIKRSRKVCITELGVEKAENINMWRSCVSVVGAP